MLIVQLCDFGNDGDACYRIHDPSRALAQLPGVTVIDCHFAHRFVPELTDRADVLILQFINDWDLLALCERRRAAGKITIFEANDFFFDIQPWNPIAESWRDRLNQELYLQLLKAADGVQASSPELAKRWRERGARSVAAFANQLPSIEALSPPVDRPLTIGWAGSPGHFADWYAVAPALQRWLSARPHVRLAVMTNEFAKSFFQLPPDRYAFSPFGSLADYFRFLKSIDIGLAPLLPTDYNRCRSDVKYLEYACQGVAGVFADLEPYRTSVVHGQTGMLYRTTTELLYELDRLADDVSLRQRIRVQAYDYVSQSRLLSQHIGQRLDWYRRLLKQPPSAEPPHAGILREAIVDGRYFRLVAQRAEIDYLEASAASSTKTGLEKTSVLVRLQPRSFAAWQLLGRVQNDRNDHRAALAALDEARRLVGPRPRIELESARAWYRLGDRDKAFAALVEALRMSPNDAFAWQAMLRFVQHEKRPDAAHWADAAVERFSECYPIVLLAALCRPPERAVAAMQETLDRFERRLTAHERPNAMPAFRDAIMTAIRLAADTVNILPLLRRAVEVFPESLALSETLAAKLLADGSIEESYQLRKDTLGRLRQARQMLSEPAAGETPYRHLFAEQILHSTQTLVPSELAVSSLELSAPFHDRNSQRNLAYECYRAGDAARAEAICRDILTFDPRDADALYLVGAVAFDAQRIEDACLWFERAAAAAPDNAVYRNSYGETLLQLGRNDAAAEQLESARRLRPDYDRVHNNLGRLAMAANDLDAAEAHFAEAVRLNPRYATALNNLGAARQAQGRIADAATCFQSALDVRPDYPEARFNLGTARQAIGNLLEAASDFRAAIRLRPTYGRAHFQLGHALEQLRQDVEALSCYETAARLRPDDSEVFRRMGDLLRRKPDWPGALAALEKAVALAPDDDDAFARLAEARTLVCDWTTYDADLDRLQLATSRQLAAGETTAVTPFQALTLPWPQEQLLAVAQNHSNATARHVRRSLTIETPVRNAPASGTRLRIGYLSGDFYDHPIGHLLYGLFGHHDRRQIEVFAYSIGPPDASVYRQRIESECEHFVDTSNLSVQQFAQRIADDRIDILVDLMGHTGINRLSVLALRPAPIQVNWLGMLGTMGADFIDYIITDPIVTPPDHAREFTERLVVMPHSYLIAQRERVPNRPVSRADVGLPDDAFVYCSFNGPYKLEPTQFAGWMRILQRVPNSVLWLHSPTPIVEVNLRREAANRGVDPRRLIFAPFLPRPAHLARHQAADLFLDTRLYNAAATATLALQAGLPVLTCPGETFASRVGASAVAAAGVPQLIANDTDHYEELAIDLAEHPERLTQLRRQLAANLDTTPLFDVPRFVRYLETAFAIMAAHRAEKRPPTPIEIRDNTGS